MALRHAFPAVNEARDTDRSVHAGFGKAGAAEVACIGRDRDGIALVGRWAIEVAILPIPPEARPKRVVVELKGAEHTSGWMSGPVCNAGTAGPGVASTVRPCRPSDLWDLRHIFLANLNGQE
jgi:hypothetical protein